MQRMDAKTDRNIWKASGVQFFFSNHPWFGSPPLMFQLCCFPFCAPTNLHPRQVPPLPQCPTMKSFVDECMTSLGAAGRLREMLWWFHLEVKRKMPDGDAVMLYRCCVPYCEMLLHDMACCFFGFYIHEGVELQSCLTRSCILVALFFDDFLITLT